MRAMGSHQSSRMISDTWITPKPIIDALGPFDLDPCVADNMPWRTATKSFNRSSNGLQQGWEGRVWLNPPYNREAVKWLNKLADHGNGIALIFARTETSWFFESVWNKATALLFIEGRIYFHKEDGTRARANAGAPSVLIAYGENNAKILQNSKIPGKFIRLVSDSPLMETIEHNGSIFIKSKRL